MSPGIFDITATPLPAHRDDWERRLLEHPNLLRTIAENVGGPFHIMYPARIVENIRAFQKVFADAEVRGDIYYAKKANKSPSVVGACAKTGTGLDVSSGGEFLAALRGGIRGADLMVTGPAKSDDLLELSARYSALVAIDNLDELARLAGLGIPSRALLRVQPPGSESRFGLTDFELDLALTRTDITAIRLEGFSFHLTGYEAAPRAEMAASLLERCPEARSLGHPITTISIGGGFGVDYVPAEAWNAFTKLVNPRWFHNERFLSPKSYYPYHFPEPGPRMLAAVLANNDLGARLREAGIRLAIEPGRALLDHAGCSVFGIQGIKTRIAYGVPYDILTVNGSSLSLSEQWFNSEYLPDPILWPQSAGSMTPTSIGGCTCLEGDMLSWRRVPLPRAAEMGDLLIYPNTAGYQMDSNESAFHDLPIPPKVVLNDVSGVRSFEWHLEVPRTVD
ncbi:type III PLP-dependent enzyme domain-containing protein [Nocardia aurantiaca]|uniref:Y4yA family PLP-dependent enzyme n=1 Tax=Nocardia aurantiaca TaxID=2675850 RepID=UPI002E1F4C6C